MSFLQRSLGAGTDTQNAASIELNRRGLSVLFVVDSNFPGFGGAEAQARKLARALEERGVYVEFVSPRVLSNQAERDTVDGFSVRRIRYPHIKLFGSVVLLFRFAHYLIRNRHRFDCMHIHVTRLLAATATVIKPLTGIPVVTKVSGFFEFEGGVLDQNKRFSPVNMVTRRVLRNVDYVQTISVETRDKLLQAGFTDGQICFIPNGIDTRHETVLRDGSGPLRIGYCGRLRKVKGVDVLIAGFAHAVKSLPDVEMELVIAGDGETRDELEAQAKQLGVFESIQFLGRINNTTSFYDELDVYVQPSFAEGLPNSVMEAMLAARIVLASDIGGNHDLIVEGEAGRLFPAGDDNALGELIVYAANHRHQLAEYGQRGKHVITERYGFDKVAEQLVDIYREK
ncbi:MAG: glycosyltransferase family 4 protein [Gammaproteobacteria bacterium]|nr:glycosyltransferase family 4 protein [Gammaproteobacteria bacterium]